MPGEILIPRTLNSVIVSLCADYQRRSIVIEKKNAPFNVIMEYRFLNYRMLDAAMEIAGERDALSFITEIGKKTGHTNSDTYICEALYKSRKKEVKANIARKLSLLG